MTKDKIKEDEILDILTELKQMLVEKKWEHS